MQQTSQSLFGFYLAQVPKQYPGLVELTLAAMAYNPKLYPRPAEYGKLRCAIHPGSIINFVTKQANEKYTNQQPWIEATVLRGDQTGRTIGFPSLNLDPALWPNRLRENPGVY